VKSDPPVLRSQKARRVVLQGKKTVFPGSDPCKLINPLRGKYPVYYSAGLFVTPVTGSIIGILQLLVSLGLAVIALYTGFSAFNRIAKGIDIEAELKRGNIAMGILTASVFTGISVVVISCIQGILVGLNKIFADGILNMNDSLDIAWSFLDLFLGVLLAIGSVYLAIQFFTVMYRRTDMITAIENGNATLAFVIAGMILSVSVIFRIGVLAIVASVF